MGIGYDGIVEDEEQEEARSKRELLVNENQRSESSESGETRPTHEDKEEEGKEAEYLRDYEEFAVSKRSKRELVDLGKVWCVGLRVRVKAWKEWRGL